MTRILYAFLIALFLFPACGPTEHMPAGQIPAERDLPRYCLQERLLFYEVLSDSNKIRLWLYTANSVTKGQLLKNPLRIYFSEKYKRNVHYFLVYNNPINPEKLTQQNEDQRQLFLFEIHEADTVDVTANYEFSIAADLDEKHFDLKIDWPRKLMRSFEEPVIGIESIASKNEERLNQVKLRGDPTQNINPSKVRSYQNSDRDQSIQRTESNFVTYQTLDLDIRFWFRLYLNRPVPE